MKGNAIPPNTIELTQAVKAAAYRLGFQLAGVTTPEPPPHFRVFEEWLEAGRHGEMAYLNSERPRQRRADPRLILPECQSILVLGMRYPKAKVTQNERSRPFTGKVAAYAWGQDYHDVLPERLKALVDFIQTQAGHPIPHHWYTDTGPLLERDLAQRAGLGWIGKNTCLIHPRLGSYFFLAEILFGIRLEPDAPFEPDRCGACSRCMEACPTGCILPDRTLDARRCISYLTIELRSAIPAELRSQMGDWIFGCDVCQQVCPWNIRFAAPTHEPAFSPAPGRPDPDLITTLTLDTGSFNQLYRGSPVRRAKRSGILRNAAVALGNQAAGNGNTVAVRALFQTLRDDPEPLVRQHAAWALGQIGGVEATNALEQRRNREADPDVRREIEDALRQIQGR